jgi:hypothetical protein
MATTIKTEKIFVGDNDTVIELTGADKDAFLEQRAKDQAEAALLEAEYEAKKQLRIDAITKLGAASGLSEAEINSILNI